MLHGSVCGLGFTGDKVVRSGFIKEKLRSVSGLYRYRLQRAPHFHNNRQMLNAASSHLPFLLPERVTWNIHFDGLDR